ncbi:hypothetical protein CVD25_22725 [Bacillus canaveralius]|uniref:DEAD/DEAH box helicase n=1 Tax=Bacillus canaveralius TaxID=1403243 RepID=A0A2N5GNJ7_9BACI|nr:DEAD/DEAH box helicase [Bacillus canaveralius]PLR83890.1 hypothetical protein CU635_08275 [Bacillus canaveralius]PLR88428.1 hypothetical protein CVD25_22725 [Bacillus canaveralius]
MFDRYAKGRYDIASKLLNNINGEDIRTLMLKITIEVANKRESREFIEDIEDLSTLMALAEALLYRILFDKSLKGEERESAALVCASAYEVLSPQLDSSSEIKIEDYEFLNRLISALLYHISGYDPNASGVVNPLMELLPVSFVDKSTEHQVMLQLCNFSILKMKQVPISLEELVIPEYITGKSLEPYMKEACLYKLNYCLNTLSKEFVVVHRKWNRDINPTLDTLYKHAMQCNQESIALIALLLKMFEENSRERAISTLRNPSPSYILSWEKHMERYLNEGIYLVWPPHKKAIEEGLFQDEINGIISIPTGTGKSLIAEHKIITKLKENKVILYLAPTIALCRQVEKNIAKVINVHQEYQENIFLLDDTDTFDTDDINDGGAVLVLTPEKCVSLIANNKELVEKCNLCVVDEFHNIFNGTRGALLDLLISRIAELSSCQFLIMSALIEESKEIEKWLGKLNDKKLSIVNLKWRPARTLRGFIAHPEISISNALKEAHRCKKKSYTTSVKTQILFCVQDVWEKNKESAYIVDIPQKMNIRFELKKNNRGIEQWNIVGYGNDLSRQIGNYFAADNTVMIFSQGTRHLLGEIEKHKKLGVKSNVVNEFSEAYLVLAKEELGFESELVDGLKFGVGIHTQAIIKEEQEAVEDFFKVTKNGILCATGTLSQGLNLTTSAVVVNTTKQYSEEGGKPLSKSEVINMLGRAGRPGFGQQSLGIVIPQYPATTSEAGFKLDHESISYLERVDGTEKTTSGFLNIAKEIANKELNKEDLDNNFTLITNVLGEPTKTTRKDLIKKTLATQFLEEKEIDSVSIQWKEWYEGFPANKELVLKAAAQSANKVSVIETLLSSIDEEKLRMKLEDTSDEIILECFFKCIQKFDINFIHENIDETFSNHIVMNQFLKTWVNGGTFIELAKVLNEHGVGTLDLTKINRTNRTSVAKSIKISKDGIRNASHIANAYVVLLKLIVYQNRDMPENFLLLSQYIRYGVNNPNALKLRKLGLPRKKAIELSGNLSKDAKINQLIGKWKRNNKIDGLDNTIGLAFLKILK